MVKKNPCILVSPLDWGIGHATRCVPVIRELQKHKARIIIGANGRSGKFLSAYFPEIETISIPGPLIHYPSSGNMAWKMAIQSPKILSGIRREHHLLEKIIRQYQIDAVISDNRFGLWSGAVYSVYITHQLRIKAPPGWGMAGHLLSGIHRMVIDNYNECWIPDYPGKENLSGELGHPVSLPSHYHYIGPLSRFSSKSDAAEPGADKDLTDLLFIISGPEPQRTIFENIVLGELAKHPEHRAIILRGLPGTGDDISPLPNVTMHSHLSDDDMIAQIKSAKLIVCRPGYSTLMDLTSLGKGAVMVPTPGQTEQEYLARYHSASPSFMAIRQSEFTLEKAVEAKLRPHPLQTFESGKELLGAAVERLIDKV